MGASCPEYLPEVGPRGLAGGLDVGHGGKGGICDVVTFLGEMEL